MSKFGTCMVCERSFHYSETSELEINLDLIGFGADVHLCQYYTCEESVRRSNPVLSALGDGVNRV
mgnify:CR=1 FL=1